MSGKTGVYSIYTSHAFVARVSMQADLSCSCKCHWCACLWRSHLDELVTENLSQQQFRDLKFGTSVRMRLAPASIAIFMTPSSKSCPDLKELLGKGTLVCAQVTASQCLQVTHSHDKPAAAQLAFECVSTRCFGPHICRVGKTSFSIRPI